MALLSGSSQRSKATHREMRVRSHMMRLHAKAASKDFVSLIKIFQYHLRVQQHGITAGNPPSLRESQALAKTMLSIYIAWDKYNTLLYPPVSEETYERDRLERKQQQAAQGESMEVENSESPVAQDTKPEMQQDEPEANQTSFHPIQNESETSKSVPQKRKLLFLLPLCMQNAEWVAKERPWWKTRYFVLKKSWQPETATADSNIASLLPPKMAKPETLSAPTQSSYTFPVQPLYNTGREMDQFPEKAKKQASINDRLRKTS